MGQGFLLYRFPSFHLFAYTYVTVVLFVWQITIDLGNIQKCYILLNNDAAVLPPSFITDGEFICSLKTDTHKKWRSLMLFYYVKTTVNVFPTICHYDFLATPPSVLYSNLGSYEIILMMRLWENNQDYPRELNSEKRRNISKL